MADVILEKKGLDDSQVTLTPNQAAAPSDSGLGATPGSSPVSLQQGLVASGYTPVTPTEKKLGWVGGTQYELDANGKPIGYQPPAEQPKTPTNTMSSEAANTDANETADLIRQQQTQLQEALRAQTAGINAQYDLQGQMQQDVQKEETATNKATQFRLGREATDYGNSAIQKLDTLHSQQQQQLQMQRQALIGQANAAYMSGNISLAKELIQNAKDVADSAAAAQKARAEQASRDIQDNIGRQTVLSKTMDNLANSNIPLTSISADTKAAYEQQFGVPAGAFDALYTANVQAAKVKSAKDLGDLATTFANLADKIPAGTTQDIKLPDGSVYTVHGTKAADQSSVHKEWVEYLGAGGVDTKGKTDAQMQQEAQANKLLGFNDYATFDANRKRAVTINPGEKEADRLAKSIVGAQDQLRQGTSWGAVWNQLYTQFKTGDAANDAALGQYLDLTLDKSKWSSGNAYEHFKDDSKTVYPNS